MPFNHNLPPSPTAFIGRDAEIQDIAGLLTDSECRLLTLVGPGGVGKTRLALEVGRACLPAFANGVYFASLASVNEPDDIVPTIVGILPVQLQDEGDQLEQLLDCLYTHQMLLILDNFEHLMDGVDLIGTLLDNVPNLKLLVTSREALNVQDEWIRHVTGMAYPTNGHLNDLNDLADYCAVQLFADRARRLRGDFSLDDDPQSVARICQLVEGLPLALELAARWLTTLTPADVAREIERGIDILETRSRDVAARHRSMRAVFAYSWNMLTEPERAVFGKLSVFRGGILREAAEAVADASLRILASLVDKSLIWRDDAGRYHIHELLRQYGAEQLDASGQAEETHHAHTRYFLDLMQRLEADIKGRAQIEALDAIEADFQNIRSAWQHGAKTGYYAAINGALESLQFFADMRGRYHEGVQMFQFALDRLTDTVTPEQRFTRLRLQLRALLIALMGGLARDYDILFPQLEACLDDAQEFDDPVLHGFIYYLMGIVVQLRIDPAHELMPMPVTYFEQAEAYFTAAQDLFYVLETQVWQSTQLIFSQYQESGVEMLTKLLGPRQKLGDHNGVAWVYQNLSEAKIRLGLYDDAETYLHKAYAKMQHIGTIKGIVMTGFKLCRLLLLRGDFEEALTRMEDLTTCIENTYLDGNLYLNSVRGFIACVQHENYTEGRRLGQQALTMPGLPFHIYSDNSPAWSLTLAACGLGDFDTLREIQHQLIKENRTLGAFSVYLTTEAATRAHAGDYREAAELLGLAFSLPDAVAGWIRRWAFVTRLRDQVETALDAHTFTQAWERGAAQDPNAELQHLLNETPARSPHRAHQTLIDPLTERELEVLALIAQGLSNRDIAENLVLSVATVKVHTRNIYQKLGVNSRTQAVARANNLALI